jgi:phage terminase large subunit-like protein
MAGAGLPGVALAQGYALNGAMKELEKLTRIDGLWHGGNPVARWCMGAAEVKRSTDDRIKLVKPLRDAAGKRVDAVAALVMAIDRWLAYQEAAPAAGFAFYSL